MCNRVVISVHLFTSPNTTAASVSENHTVTADMKSTENSAVISLELSCQLNKEKFHFKAKLIQINQELFPQMAYVFEVLFPSHKRSLLWTEVLLGPHFSLYSCFHK